MTTHNSPAKKRSPFSFLCLMLLLLCAPGCGGCRGTLTGTVTYEGEPIQAGSVLLVGSDLRPVTAAIKEDGTYTFTNVPTGDVKLAVYNPARRRGWAALFQVVNEGGTAEGGKVIKLSGNRRKKRPVIPASYSDHELSGLRTTIERGSNEYDIEIEMK
jgi:hypothetical protein